MDNARLLEAQYNIAAINKCLFPVVSDESLEAYKIFNRLKSEIKTAQKELDEYEMRKNKLKNFFCYVGKTKHRMGITYVKR